MIRGFTHSLAHCLKGRRRKVAALFFVSLAAGFGGAQLALSAAPGDGLLTGSVEPPALLQQAAPCEIRTAAAPRGEERLYLAARLREGGGLIGRPVAWTVLAVDEVSGRVGRKVHSSEQAQAQVALPAGQYEVRARYGYRLARQRITVEEGRSVSAVFILDVGGVRAISLLDGLGPAIGVRVEHRFYAASGRGRSRLVATSRGQGELLRLGKGDYRVESRFIPGNARAETSVRIKPGVLSSLEIRAHAALVRVEAETGRKRWQLRDAGGAWKFSGSGGQNLVLAPGEYVLAVEEAGKRSLRRFHVSAGESRELRVH